MQGCEHSVSADKHALAWVVLVYLFTRDGPAPGTSPGADRWTSFGTVEVVAPFTTAPGSPHNAQLNTHQLRRGPLVPAIQNHKPPAAQGPGSPAHTTPQWGRPCPSPASVNSTLQSCKVLCTLVADASACPVDWLARLGPTSPHIAHTPRSPPPPRSVALGPGCVTATTTITIAWNAAANNRQQLPLARGRCQLGISALPAAHALNPLLQPEQTGTLTAMAGTQESAASGSAAGRYLYCRRPLAMPDPALLLLLLPPTPCCCY